MPSDNDISGSFLPQHPMNVAMLPALLKNENIVFCTNPHKFSMNGLNFLGTSGQNIEDICRFTDMSNRKEIDVLYETLQMRHLAPTCPDTLRCYPFEKDDPLIIREPQNVYFS
jgi:DNA polymerase delta subunit 2